MESVIFQTEGLSVLKQYESDNFKIEYTPIIEHEKYVAVYFSSNGIYFPNDEENFQKTIVEKDKYEWSKNKFPRAEKHIFVRDIFKQWYLEGINHEINSIEKLGEFLKKECDGYKVVTLGSSAGGYAAVLFGNILKAEYTISFAGQFSLHPQILKSKPPTDPLLFKYLSSEIGTKYFDISSLARNSDVPVFYFVPARCPIDVEQMQLVEDSSNVHIFKFRSKSHGVPVLLPNLVKIFRMNIKELKDLQNTFEGREINQILFSFKVSGIKTTFNYLIKKTVKRAVSKTLRM